MSYSLPDVRKIDVKGKRIFFRADLDIPLEKTENGFEIEDDTRLLASLPTLNFLLENNAKVIVAGHLDRPEGKDPSKSLRPVADWLSKNLKFQISNPKSQKIGDFDGWVLSENLSLLENLRFYKEEEKNDLEFSQKLSSLSDIFVNDAFAMCHREHSSVVGVAKILPHFAGIHLQKEVEVLAHVMENPKRPLAVIIGGKKIETKLPLAEKMHHVADYVLVGGLIAQQGGEFLKIQHEKLNGTKSALLIADANKEKTDITEKDAENFMQIINMAETIIWNGPMGLIGKSDSEIGTKIIAYGIAKTNAYKVVGGGDTTEYLKKENLTNKFDFVSTGGGAMLSFLSSEKLPGLEALRA